MIYSIRSNKFLWESNASQQNCQNLRHYLSVFQYFAFIFFLEKKSLAFHMENQSEYAKEDLRNWIEKFNESHTEKNNYEVLPESPNVEIYSLSYEHAEAILKYVKTDEGKTDAFRKKVTKIIDINEVITIGKFVMMWLITFLIIFFHSILS